MIVCFEGPSAIGKTQLSKQLNKTSVIIPEVNVLFKGEEKKDTFWYYKKQIERYQLSLESDEMSILDGDIFQPLWYNWIYCYPAEFYSKEETHAFFLKAIRENRICFPDLYILFETTVNKLKERKKNDLTRSRRNFEKHLKMIQPQRKYFAFLKEKTDINVEFVEYDDLESTKRRVLEIISTNQKREINCENNFKQITNWLDKTIVN
ncbi:hypothetical protein ATO12_03500 [Aquimarina atlantica]|uniref:Chloramphenicol acetyltransferase n=1 Tax=Aquimarina atlantica TaxID=1317122 RepID=A0A023C1Q7_9FLAO|nr:hypothetical protein [Aquimarina atlantica]EZH75868.1 hypothetical protein ATO12_03500 [Aquimarina atlantica]